MRESKTFEAGKEGEIVSKEELMSEKDAATLGDGDLVEFDKEEEEIYEVCTEELSQKQKPLPLFAKLIAPFMNFLISRLDKSA